MDPERWRQVQEVFHAALESPEEARPEVIAAASKGDPDLASRVEALLDAHVQATTFVDRPIFRWSETSDDELPATIGPYRPLEILGRGGMGVVYRAERADQTFEKQVALKVVSRDLTTPDLARRFRAERQILADLEHPGIARLLDGGTTDDGRPYLVMELVDGVPVDRFIVDKGLSLEARLDLFGEICQAVHTAHQNLVVHRDLKPANILVTDQGRPKLLDFGIAKLLAPASGRSVPEATGPGSRWMTPSHASPEQVRGDAVTTASDVYALGVLLFEMLTGQRPYPARPEKPHELTQAILDRPAPRPSDIVASTARDDVSGDDDSRENDGERRAARRLAKSLRGDLDRIVLTALRKAPERRYPSAEALAADVGRFRRGQPIAARPDAFAYRARKFVRRHRLAVSATAMAFAALSFSTATALVQQTRAERQRDRAEAVSGFLVQLFENADPYHARGEELTVRELLDRGANELARSEADDTVADLATAMGEAYLGLGLYRPAGELLHRGLDHRRQRHGEEHREVAASNAALGRLRLAEGNFAAAEVLLDGALRQRRALLGASHPLTGKSCFDLANLLHRRGDLEDAEALFREAITILRSADGHGEQLARALSGLSALERDRGLYASAESLQREALETVIAARGDAPDPAVARFRTDLGTLLRRQGDDAAAEALYRVALKTQRHLYPEGHPEIATTLTSLASAVSSLGRFDEADTLFGEAVDLRLQLLGPAHPLVANTLNNRANLAADRGRRDQAEALYRQALALLEAALPDGHKDLAKTRSNLGLILAARGEYEQAEALHRQALAAYRALYGDRHVWVAVVLNNLADSFRAQSRYGEARPLYEESVATLRDVLGANHPNQATGLNNLALVYRAQGDHPAAAAAFEEARRISERGLGPDHPKTLRITLFELSLATETEAFDTVASRIEDFLERCQQALGPAHPTTARARGLLGELLLSQGRLDDAEPHLQASFDALTENTAATAKARHTAAKRLEELRRQRALKDS
ncbi:MAG: serine/threonine-protein kinase [Acidobacteriota bacterium]